MTEFLPQDEITSLFDDVHAQRQAVREGFWASLFERADQPEEDE